MSSSRLNSILGRLFTRFCQISPSKTAGNAHKFAQQLPSTSVVGSSTFAGGRRTNESSSDLLSNEKWQRGQSSASRSLTIEQMVARGRPKKRIQHKHKSPLDWGVAIQRAVVLKGGHSVLLNTVNPPISPPGGLFFQPLESGENFELFDEKT